MAIAVASGCSGPPPIERPQPLTPTNFDKIKTGMSLVEVIKLIGAWSNFERDATVKVNEPAICALFNIAELRR